MGTSGGGSSKRGRPYGVMLILAVGAAVFAVMMLHKMRERRIFNILISEKDHNLLTLQLLLQKEKDSAKEMKKKIEELKSKARFLKTQKIELNDKLMEMQIITSSLREEQSVMESVLDERQNEIKMLREKENDSNKNTNQMTSLKELLKSKEAEIKEMKDQLERSSNVLPVSTDQSSKPPRNLTVAEISGNAGIGESQMEEALTSNSVEAVTTAGQVSSKTASQSLENKEIPSEAGLQRQENSQVSGEGLQEKGESGNKKAGNSQVQEEISGGSQIIKNVNPHNGSDVKEVLRFSAGALTNKNEGSTRENDGSNHGTPQDIDSQTLGMNSDVGKKLEEPAGSQKVLSSRVKEKNSRRSTLRGSKRNNSRDKTGTSEDGAKDNLRVKTTAEGKLEGKLWRTIHARRQYKERTSAYAENSNPSRSENRDFAYKGEDQTMDAAADYDDDK